MRMEVDVSDYVIKEVLLIECEDKEILADIRGLEN